MNIGSKKILFYAIAICSCCIMHQNIFGQKNNSTVFSLLVHYKDTSNKIESPSIKTTFTDLKALYDYANALPQMLVIKGYLVASIDSSWLVADTLHIQLYLGNKYNWIQLGTKNIDKEILYKIGYAEKDFTDKPFNIIDLEVLKERLIHIYENEGYPFAKVYLDSVKVINDKISAVLTLNKLVLYKIDSIRNYGKLKLNNKFLQRYLNIKNGSLYNSDKLQDVDRRLLELPYAESLSNSSLDMLGRSAVLNINVNNKKSSEASAIFGFLPSANNTGKTQITGDVNLDLKNVFGAGEGLQLKYQALQPKSPRLNFGYDKPYIFNSAFGLGFSFDFFKKDSSFLQISAQTSLQLNLSKYQSGKILVQIQNTNLLQGGIDTNQIKSSKKLPEIIDVKAVNSGVNYEFRNTNYRFNPLKGNDINTTILIGVKNIVKNNDILSLKETGFDFASLYTGTQLRSYQLRVKLSAAHYFPLSKSSTFKTALNGGFYISPVIFRNEVFQIGGYKLLRGFDEESIYATKYAVFTAEYRSLLSLNSYLFGFADFGATNAKYQTINSRNIFISTGVGISYETKAGLLNVSFAMGKRDDVNFNIRQAVKIHFGYVNYF
jgi:outer membrane translocation and assembly module TamA